jgi:ribosomal 50S subunit-recycling heat shock protein
MRLDLFLKQSRLIPRRTLAQRLCEAGAVTVGGLRAKSAREVHIGDEITIKRPDSIITLRVLDIPTRHPSKAQARTLYEVIRFEQLEQDEISDWCGMTSS